MTTSSAFALRSIERRFWLMQQVHPRVPVAQLGRVVHLRGALDVKQWHRAFACVAEAPALRMRVHEVAGVPMGTLGAAALLEVVMDGGDLDAALRDVVQAPYDLARGPLFRARLLRVERDEWRLVLGAHHLVVDGWSFSSAIARALGAALRGQAPAWDVDAWLASRRASTESADDVARSVGAWRAHLAGAQTLALPTQHPAPPRPTGYAVGVALPLDKALLAHIDDAAARTQQRAVHRWLAATAIECARASRTRDVLLGTTRATRPLDVLHDGVDARTIGCFVRTTPVRIVLSDDDTMQQATDATRDAVRASLALPGFDAGDTTLLGPDAPAVSAIFNYLPVRAFDDDLLGLQVAARRVIAGGTAVRAAVTCDVARDDARLVVELDADVFDRSAAQRLAERIVLQLETSITRPSTTVAKAPRLLASDLTALALAQGDAARRRGVVGGSLAQLLQQALDDDDDTAALVATSVRSTRRQVLRDAWRIAAVLRRRGARPGAFVVVHTSDPVCSVQAIVGTILAGAAYVPVDPAIPSARLQHIVSACAPICIVRDDDVRAWTSEDDAEPLEPAALHGHDPAYVIFTSGSTGVPKGVVVSHDAVVAQLQARTALGFARPTQALLLAPFFFDGSVETLFWTLTTRGVLHVLGEEQRRDPHLIRTTLQQARIDYTSAVPALWSAVLDAAGEQLADLRFVIVGGEALTPALVDKHHRIAQHARLVNEYGPTESTVFSTSWEVPARGVPSEILIGTAAPHVHLHVVDDRGEAVPVGEPGELVVTGIGVAHGYVGAPEATARAFAPLASNVSVDGRTYRTGDLVRVRDDGNLVWLARLDDQVKLRGVRIELGEVEAALAQLPGVVEAAAVVHGDRIVGYVAPGPLDEDAALRAMAARLPEAMLPAHIVSLPALPKTANDKIHKKALPAPTASVETFVAPSSDLERSVAAIWAEVLDRRDISVTRSFFSYGGHSMQAATIVSRMKAQLGVDVPLSSLMTARTVRTLAQSLERNEDARASSVVIPLRERSTHAGADDALRPPVTTTEGPAVVFLPGIGGHVYTFASIAARLSCDAFGLRAYGAEAGETPLPRLEEIAARNIDELHRAGVRDVVLAGYSMGARVAFEMCAQMQRRGLRPRHLVLFDAFAPGYPTKLPVWQRAWIHAREFATRDLPGKVEYVRDRIESLALKRAYARGDTEAFAPAQMPDVDHARRDALRKLWGVSALADHRYWPTQHIAVPSTLFCAADGFEWIGTVMDDPLMGWGTWIDAPIARVGLPGDHLHLFADANVDRIAAALNAIVSSLSSTPRGAG